MRIREIAQTRVRYGYRMIRVLLNREGWKVGKDLAYRLYKEEGWGCASGLLGDGARSCIGRNGSNQPVPTRFGRWTSSPINSAMAGASGL